MGSCQGYLTVQVCECVCFHSCFFLPFWSCFAFDLLGVQILFLRRVVFADNNFCTDLWSLHARLTIYALVISPSSVCPAKSGLTVQTLGAKQELAYPLPFIVKARQ